MRMALELALHNPVCAASLWELMHCSTSKPHEDCFFPVKEVRSHDIASWL